MVQSEDRASNASVCRDNREFRDDCLPELANLGLFGLEQRLPVTVSMARV